MANLKEVLINGVDIFDLIYPIGSIYMSVNNINPQALFGGRWEAWGSGRVPVAVNVNDTNFNTVEKTGGSSTHALTLSEMPSHEGHYCSWGGDPYYLDKSLLSAYGSNGRGWTFQAGNETIPSTQSLGSGTAHNNLQPYITCYMWKRTA